ncbi:hypothetical protein ACFE04_024278 [Oxalis oulophora]
MTMNEMKTIDLEPGREFMQKGISCESVMLDVGEGSGILAFRALSSIPICDETLSWSVVEKSLHIPMFGEVSWLLTVPAVAIIGREITMSAVREWAASMDNKLLETAAVNNLGKWKTATQMIALTILLATRESRNKRGYEQVLDDNDADHIPGSKKQKLPALASMELAQLAVTMNLALFNF